MYCWRILGVHLSITALIATTTNYFYFDTLGVGVFSHSVNLEYERLAGNDHPPNQPVLYPNLIIDDEYIVKPKFEQGREIIMFRDIDCLHSAPDVAYRASVMRFM